MQLGSVVAPADPVLLRCTNAPYTEGLPESGSVRARRKQQTKQNAPHREVVLSQLPARVTSSGRFTCELG